MLWWQAGELTAPDGQERCAAATPKWTTGLRADTEEKHFQITSSIKVPGTWLMFPAPSRDLLRLHNFYQPRTIIFKSDEQFWIHTCGNKTCSPVTSRSLVLWSWQPRSHGCPWLEVMKNLRLSDGWCALNWDWNDWSWRLERWLALPEWGPEFGSLGPRRWGVVYLLSQYWGCRDRTTRPC